MQEHDSAAQLSQDQVSYLQPQPDSDTEFKENDSTGLGRELQLLKLHKQELEEKINGLIEHTSTNKVNEKFLLEEIEKLRDEYIAFASKYADNQPIIKEIKDEFMTGSSVPDHYPHVLDDKALHKESENDEEFKKVIRSFFANFVNLEMGYFTNKYHKLLDYDLKKGFYVDYSSFPHVLNSSGKRLSDAWDHYNVPPSGKYLNYWSALKKTQVFSNNFSDSIQTIDQNYENYCLRESLSPSSLEQIVFLPYYPNPDSIRNLILLGSSNLQGSRRDYLNRSFQLLSQRKDWGDILSKTEKKYPQIGQLRSFLENWNDDVFNTSSEEVKLAINDLSLQLINDSNQDRLLVSAATAALSGLVIIDVLQKKEIVSSDDAQLLQQACDLIQDFKRDNTISESKDLLSEAIKKIGVKKMTPQYNSLDSTQFSTLFRNVVSLSEYILVNKDNPQALQYLSSEELINLMIREPVFDAKNNKKVLEAFHNCPILATNRELREFYCSNFENTKDLEIIITQIDNVYAELGYAKKIILNLIVDGKLSVRRAAELGVHSRDLFTSETFPIIADNLEMFIQTEEDERFYWDLVNQYQNDTDLLSIVNLIKKKELPRYLVLKLPTLCPLLFQDSNLQSKRFIFSDARFFIKNERDIEYINEILSTWGSESVSFLRIYEDLISENLIQRNENDFSKLSEILHKSNPQVFLKVCDRQQWRTVFGEDTIKQILDVLPKASDEKRNAFTHNKYDRTSLLIQYLYKSKDADLKLTKEDLHILSNYIKNFGLSNNAVLFRFYKYLNLYEKKAISVLPKDIQSSGLTSLEELQNKFRDLQQLVFSAEPLTELSRFNSFEMEMLRCITKSDSHKFHADAPDFDTIVHDYQNDISEGKIEPVPDEYENFNITIPKIDLKTEIKEAKKYYDDLHAEIYVALKTLPDVNSLVEGYTNLINLKIEETEQILAQASEDKVKFIQQQLEKHRAIISTLESGSISSVDDFIHNIMSIRPDKTLRPYINSLIRRALFQKVFSERDELHNNELNSKLTDDITANSIVEIINLVQEPITNHLINFDRQEISEHWSPKVLNVMSKNRQWLSELFEPHMTILKKTVKDFEYIPKSQEVIECYKDRGFIGEMSGYLGDVCYTRVHPLLTYKDFVVPYKFIVKDTESNDSRFVGSVLIFDVETKSGEKAMLVRAFELLNEAEINTPQFIEQFLDKMAMIAQKRGVSYILVPGELEAISDYYLTLSHINSKYVNDKKAVSLANPFTFNHYDLTNYCFVAREVNPPQNSTPLVL